MEKKDDQFEATVRIVVSCSARKSTPPADRLKLRDYSGEIADRADAWLARIAEPDGPTRPAAELYKGEHWRVVQQFESAAAVGGVGVDVWVASAGYGLIRASSEIESYSATFAARAEDSISRSSRPDSDAEYWWSRLVDRHRSGGDPTSLFELAATDPATPMVVALSGSYIRAVQSDLLSAAEVLGDPGRLLIVSGDDRESIRRHRLPVDARLQGVFGGTLVALNARVVRLLLETSGRHGWNASQVRRQLSAILAEQPERVRYDRRQLTDVEVAEFIRSELDVNGPTAQSVLLRRLRDSNRACEQKRFGRLYRCVMEGART